MFDERYASSKEFATGKAIPLGTSMPPLPKKTKTRIFANLKSVKEKRCAQLGEWLQALLCHENKRVRHITQEWLCRPDKEGNVDKFIYKDEKIYKKLLQMQKKLAILGETQQAMKGAKSMAEIKQLVETLVLVIADGRPTKTSDTIIPTESIKLYGTSDWPSVGIVPQSNPIMHEFFTVINEILTTQRLYGMSNNAVRLRIALILMTPLPGDKVSTTNHKTVTIFGMIYNYMVKGTNKYMSDDEIEAYDRSPDKFEVCCRTLQLLTLFAKEYAMQTAPENPEAANVIVQHLTASKERKVKDCLPGIARTLFYLCEHDFEAKNNAAAAAAAAVPSCLPIAIDVVQQWKIIHPKLIDDILILKKKAEKEKLAKNGCVMKTQKVLEMEAKGKAKEAEFQAKQDQMNADMKEAELNSKTAKLERKKEVEAKKKAYEKKVQDKRDQDAIEQDQKKDARLVQANLDKRPERLSKMAALTERREMHIATRKELELEWQSKCNKGGGNTTSPKTIPSLWMKHVSDDERRVLGSNKEIKAALEAGANVNELHHDGGHSALHCFLNNDASSAGGGCNNLHNLNNLHKRDGCDNGHRDMILLLLKQPAININGHEGLFAACGLNKKNPALNDRDVFIRFLELGDNPNMCTAIGKEEDNTTHSKSSLFLRLLNSCNNLFPSDKQDRYKFLQKCLEYGADRETIFQDSVAALMVEMNCVASIIPKERFIDQTPREVVKAAIFALKTSIAEKEANPNYTVEHYQNEMDMLQVQTKYLYLLDTCCPTDIRQLLAQRKLQIANQATEKIEKEIKYLDLETKEEQEDAIAKAEWMKGEQKRIETSVASIADTVKDAECNKEDTPLAEETEEAKAKESEETPPAEETEETEDTLTDEPNTDARYEEAKAAALSALDVRKAELKEISKGLQELIAKENKRLEESKKRRREKEAEEASKSTEQKEKEAQEVKEAEDAAEYYQKNVLDKEQFITSNIAAWEACAAKCNMSHYVTAEIKVSWAALMEDNLPKSQAEYDEFAEQVDNMSKKDLTGMFRMLVHPDVSDSDYDSDEENEDIFKLKPKKERSGAYLLSSSESDNEDQETDAKLGNMSIEVTISKVCQSNHTIIYTLHSRGHSPTTHNRRHSTSFTTEISFVHSTISTISPLPTNSFE